MNRHQIDEQLKQRHRKAWREARAPREVGQGHRRRSERVFQRRQQSPVADGTGCHATAFGSWSGGHSISPGFRVEPCESRLTVFEGKPPRWWVVEQGI